MAVQNCVYYDNSTGFGLTCDLCLSDEIIETEQSYVCSRCGCVLEIPIMKSHYPYKKEQVHHEISSGSSSIGTQKERCNHQQSSKLERMQKLQQQRSYKYYALLDVELQILRLLSGLNLPHSFKAPILRSFKKLKATLQKGTYMLENLIPVLVYFYCRKQGIPINEQELMTLTNMGKKEYNRYKFKLIDLMIGQRDRNRKKLIKNKLFRLSQEFHLGMDFYNDAICLLKVLWKDIYCTKDDVIAGLVSSVAVLCHYQNKVTINSLCKRLNIAMSTIQSRVKRHLIEEFNVEGFESLVKSADIVKRTIYKLGIFTAEKKELKGESKGKETSPEFIRTPKIIHITQLNVEFSQKILKTKKYYNNFIFMIRNQADLQPIYVSLLLPLNHYKDDSKHNRNFNKDKCQFVFHSKGPP